MAFQPVRVPPRPKQSKFKVAVDENAVVAAPTRSKLVNTGSTKAIIERTKAGLPPATRQVLAARSALGEIHNVRKKTLPSKTKENVVATKPVDSKQAPAGLKRRRSPSLHAATSRPVRLPQPPTAATAATISSSRKAVAVATTKAATTTTVRSTGATTDSDAPPRRLGRMLQAMQSRRQSQVIPSSSQSIPSSSGATIPSDGVSTVVLSSRPPSPAATSDVVVAETDDEDETAKLPAATVAPTPPKATLATSEPSPKASPTPESPRPESLFELMSEGDWLFVPPAKRLEYQKELERVASSFKDEAEFEDPTMVAEYADEIFEYMSKLEEECMPMPKYMAGQQEITWAMRATLVDWLLQVHLRYHMLPETLWIAVNILDRFLSKRVVSVMKLQLVGVTAIFIAAKYEEIVAPGVDEYVKMTEGGYKRDEILKGEKIILQTIDFRVSTYCSPYSWVRKISKADDYNLQTRTLCKFLMELTLLDHRFLRVKPSLIAAIGMYSARKMLGNDWDDAFVFYSGRVEEELMMGHEFIVEALVQPDFQSQYIYKKYTSRRFLQASVYACSWAQENYKPAQRSRAQDKNPRLEAR